MNKRVRIYMIAQIANKTGAEFLTITHQVHEVLVPGMTFDEGLAILYGALCVDVSSNQMPGLLEGEIHTYLEIRSNE